MSSASTSDVLVAHVRCAFMFLCQRPAPAIAGNFVGLIIKGYGYTGLQSLLLQIPTWAIPAIASPIAGYLLTHYKWWQERKTVSHPSRLASDNQWMLIIISLIALVSEVILYTNPPGSPNKVVPLVFVSLLSIDQSVCTPLLSRPVAQRAHLTDPLILSLVGVNFAGTTKKQTAIALTYLFCTSLPASTRHADAQTAQRILVYPSLSSRPSRRATRPA